MTDRTPEADFRESHGEADIEERLAEAAKAWLGADE
jgi:hypothetical protein